MGVGDVERDRCLLDDSGGCGKRSAASGMMFRVSKDGELPNVSLNWKNTTTGSKFWGGESIQGPYHAHTMKHRYTYQTPSSLMTQDLAVSGETRCGYVTRADLWILQDEKI